LACGHDHLRSVYRRNGPADELAAACVDADNHITSNHGNDGPRSSGFGAERAGNHTRRSSNARCERDTERPES
jgi:hypothetical protein